MINSAMIHRFAKLGEDGLRECLDLDALDVPQRIDLGRVAVAHSRFDGIGDDDDDDADGAANFPLVAI